MKKVLVSIVLGLGLWQVSAAELTWHTDLEKALVVAKKEQKMVLLNFTGSDWCTFCKRLSRDVWQAQEFADYAKKNLVLVEVDFPERKQLSAAQKRANQALKDKYKVEGFPTLVMLDAKGERLGEQVGYDGSGPKAIINLIEKRRGK